MVNDLKKNEKKVKNKFGVFNGSAISQESFGTEQSLVIHELEEQDFTIEKSTTNEFTKNTMIVDGQTILNNRKKRPVKKYVKWILAILVVLIVIGIIIFLTIKFSL
jgi:CRISPR/Cas system CMR-associated protein Cmr5 small subunit